MRRNGLPEKGRFGKPELNLAHVAPRVLCVVIDRDVTMTNDEILKRFQKTRSR
jgi:hypothetical protein